MQDSSLIFSMISIYFCSPLDMFWKWWRRFGPGKSSSPAQAKAL